jgi:hypothetical protein
MNAFGRRLALGCLVLGVLASHDAGATEPFAKVGTYGASWLSVPIGVRNIGMGSTGAADASGFGTGHYNPATIAWSKATSLIGSYEDFGPDISISQFQLSSPFPLHADSTGEWRFGGSLAYSHMGMEPQSDRTIFLPEGTGRTFDASDWMLSAIATTQWHRGVFSVAAGADTKFIRSNVANGHSDIWAFDWGLITALPVQVGGGMVRPRIGYSALNLDSGGSYDGREFNIETEQRYGVGLDLETPLVMLWRRPVSALSVSVDYDAIDRQEHASQNYAAGFEVSFADLLHVRYGVLDHDYTMYGAGVGWDYGRVLFRLDYAHSRPEDWILREMLDLERDTFGGLIGVRW